MSETELLRRRAEDAEQLNQDLIAKVDELETELAAAGERLADAAKKLDSARMGASGLSTDVASRDKKIAALTTQLADKEKEVARLTGELEKSRSELERTRTLVNEALEEIEALRAAMSQR